MDIPRQAKGKKVCLHQAITGRIVKGVALRRRRRKIERKEKQENSL